MKYLPPEFVSSTPAPSDAPDDQRRRVLAMGVRLGLLTGMPGLALTGCGGGGDTADGTGSTPATTPTPAPSPAPTPSPTPAPAPAPVPATTRYGDLRGADLGPQSSLNGAVPFPASHAWNTDVSTAPIDPASATILASIGLTSALRPDFGAGLWDGGPIGIPYHVVAGSQARVTVHMVGYPEESDAGPYPLPAGVGIEGGSDGDRHILVIDRDNNRLYELYRAFPQADGSWNADIGAVFQLDSAAIRPTAQPGWSSADAAGLPIFPGLVRYDEASRGPGGIAHALRFTAPRTRAAYVPPATHSASSSTDPALPPMGLRVRLRGSFVIPASFSAEARAVLQALQTYGMFLADHGSAWYLSGAPDERWNNSRLQSELGQVKGSDFEVIRMDGLVTTR
jgi:hypothetical protein